jgi:chromosome segregation ATPase
MKKWMYVIFPTLGLAIFLALYFPAKQASEDRVRREADEVARLKAVDDAHKKELEDKARADSDRRSAENARDLAAKAAEREAKRVAEMQGIQAQTDASNREIDRLTKEADALQAKLEALQKQKEVLTREDFDLAKQVELARVNQGNADLEIQRMVDMIASRAGQSAMANVPPPATN